jgi:hypothetical protein
MEIITKCFKDSSIHLYAIGDCHIGDKCFGKESRRKLQGYIKWIKETPNAYAVLMGDIVNCATMTSPSSPFAQDMTLAEQIAKAVYYFDPIKDKILGAIDGNHEQRLSRFSGFSPTISICERLGIHYLQASAVIIFRLGCRPTKEASSSGSRASFAGYFHHTTGGGATVGGKLNRVEKLTGIVADADFYCGSHNHLLAASHHTIKVIDRTLSRVENLRQILVDCGGFLEWDGSYAEEKELGILKIGSPRINMFIKRRHRKGDADNETVKDIHVSI